LPGELGEAGPAAGAIVFLSGRFFHRSGICLQQR
jgi:hypothetical protein